MSEPFLVPILNILITKINKIYFQTVVQEMNKLGIIVDLSHTSVQVMIIMIMIY